jgi:hypothetical protein
VVEEQECRRGVVEYWSRNDRAAISSLLLYSSAPLLLYSSTPLLL